MEKTNTTEKTCPTFYARLAELQNELKAPKNKYNSFSNFHYRSCEDIYEAVKPLLVKYKMVLNLCDYVEQIGDRYYVKACAHIQGTAPEDFSLYDDGSECWAQQTSIGWAREEEVKKGMDGSQISGTASSYARKYALNGLLLIDDTKDADTDEYHRQTEAGGAATSQVDRDAWLRQVDECYSVSAVKNFWKDNKQTIPADILKEIYSACKEKMAELEKGGAR